MRQRRYGASSYVPKRERATDRDIFCLFKRALQTARCIFVMFLFLDSRERSSLFSFGAFQSREINAALPICGRSSDKRQINARGDDESQLDIHPDTLSRRRSHGGRFFRARPRRAWNVYPARDTSACGTRFLHYAEYAVTTVTNRRAKYHSKASSPAPPPPSPPSVGF